jgi:hypothetical protein
LLKSLRVADDAVLIGGQALAFWVAYFDLPLPAGLRTYISSDADFLGALQHVATFAEALGGRAEYPSKRQISALHGAVTKVTTNGPKILVDVLRSVVGLAADEVKKRAIKVHHPSDHNVLFEVMNPVDCLVSRFENLRKLPDKDKDVGAWQAKISIAVCNAYLKTLIGLGDERAAIQAATRALRLAGTAPGLQAFRNHGLELLDSVPVDLFETRSFREQQYAKTAAKVLSLREAYQPPRKKTSKRPG